MKTIKIWFDRFSAKDAQTLAKKHSNLKPILKAIAKHAEGGERECFTYYLTPEDMEKLVKLGYDVSLYPDNMINKYLIKW